MSRYIHSQQATNKAFKNLDFSDVGTIKEIIFRKREYQEYITPQNFGSGVFLCVNYDKINIIIKSKQV